MNFKEVGKNIHNILDFYGELHIILKLIWEFILSSSQKIARLYVPPELSGSRRVRVRRFSNFSGSGHVRVTDFLKINGSARVQGNLTIFCLSKIECFVDPQFKHHNVFDQFLWNNFSQTLNQTEKFLQKNNNFRILASVF